MPSLKVKTGICEAHLYNQGDKKKRNITYHPECKLWICNDCDNTVIKAMATVNKNIELKLKYKSLN